MCVIDSFFGIPLQKAVYGIGIFKLVLTLILAIISIVGRSLVPCENEDGDLLEGGDIKCVGPYIRQIFFDLFIPLTCALLLIYGAKRKSSCLLLIWFIIVFVSYIQYLVVVFESNWDKASDWVAIGYVVHYTTVAIVVFSFMQVAKRNEGVVHNNIIKTEQGQAAATQATAAAPATTTITVQQQQQPPAAAYPQQQPQQQQFQQQAPYDPNMAAYAGQPAGYAPQPAGYPAAPPAYGAPQAPYAPQNT